MNNRQTPSKNAMAQRSRVLSFFEHEQFQQAWQLGRKILPHHPGDLSLLEVCGLAAAMSGNVRDAGRQFGRLVKSAPHVARYWSHLGNIRFRTGENTDAALSFKEAAKIEPDNPEHQTNLGLVEAAQGNLADAELHFSLALDAQPDDLTSLWNLARVYKQQHRHFDTVMLMRRAAQVAPGGNPNFWLEYGAAALPVLDAAAIIESIEKTRRLAPQTAETQAFLATQCSAIGRRDEALACARRTLVLQPGDPEVVSKAAAVLAEYGETDEAVGIYRALIDAHPGFCRAYFRLSHLIRFDPDRREDMNLIRAMVRMLRGGVADPERLHFALAKAYDEIGDTAAAIRHLTKGNARCRQLYPYDPGRDRDRVRAMKDVFHEWDGKAGGGPGPGLARVPDGVLSPVFVVGVPRSGTTLVGQIIAAHPRVASCGELELMPNLVAGHPMAAVPAFAQSGDLKVIGDEYRRRVHAIAGGRLRAVDKLPANLFNVGAVWRAMPDARVILIRRNPMAVGLSLYQSLFGDALRFSYDLDSIGLSADLADHWTGLAPSRLLPVDYEDLVLDPEPAMRKMIDFCALDWHPNCERFFEHRGKISTASLNQANRPIYTNAVERWKRYEAHLAPLADALAAAPDGFRARAVG